MVCVVCEQRPNPLHQSVVDRNEAIPCMASMGRDFVIVVTEAVALAVVRAVGDDDIALVPSVSIAAAGSILIFLSSRTHTHTHNYRLAKRSSINQSIVCCGRLLCCAVLCFRRGRFYRTNRRPSAVDRQIRWTGRAGAVCIICICKGTVYDTVSYYHTFGPNVFLAWVDSSLQQNNSSLLFPPSRSHLVAIASRLVYIQYAVSPHEQANKQATADDCNPPTNNNNNNNNNNRSFVLWMFHHRQFRRLSTTTMIMMMDSSSAHCTKKSAAI